ncbi:isoprenoid biosynthesis glyoxalase ElbB [Glaciecola sp. XM2]|jgi:enhancing lycopene biosynthesis protein 2|uniref:isoprenoid biosynthesis glyoxalase ElbB n=1 Tax=Glaciecola sp. XM2 TaxID=1914931 RepID=UPI001BDEF147|nr:isoprenoid biosynthesis glyoxalase ElbB [Glaciecola sp. XM2]MBT1450257.1 isoprenoid biosynthesis glyoxalase ElbB [Glaciecola sp. XM2]
MKKVAVVLSGCGVFDGAEIQESVLSLLHIAKAGASYQCFAPDVAQMHTLNHITGEEMGEPRNVLIEASRISRGDIKPVDELDAASFDALIVPGGFGAAKNLSDFAVNGANCNIEKSTFEALQSFAKAKKPAGYICIAPAMIPLIYGESAKATIGTDPDTAAAINTMGGQHVECAVRDIVIDEANKLVSTPAYMLAESILQADEGIKKLVDEVLNMCE